MIRIDPHESALVWLFRSTGRSTGGSASGAAARPGGTCATCRATVAQRPGSKRVEREGAQTLRTKARPAANCGANGAPPPPGVGAARHNPAPHWLWSRRSGVRVPSLTPREWPANVQVVAVVAPAERCRRDPIRGPNLLGNPPKRERRRRRPPAAGAAYTRPKPSGRRWDLGRGALPAARSAARGSRGVQQEADGRAGGDRPRDSHSARQLELRTRRRQCRLATAQSGSRCCACRRTRSSSRPAAWRITAA